MTDLTPLTPGQLIFLFTCAVIAWGALAVLMRKDSHR